MKRFLMLVAAAAIHLVTPAAHASDGFAAQAMPADDPVVEVDTGDVVSVQRERVLAELRAANELGLLMLGEGDIPCADTRAQHAIAASGEAAVQRLHAAQREILAVQQWLGRSK